MQYPITFILFQNYPYKENKSKIYELCLSGDAEKYIVFSESKGYKIQSQKYS
jgi:hypothetical protein